MEPDAALDGLARDVIGAAIEVHRWLGPGFLETVYEDALAVELGLRHIVFQRQVPLAIDYKGRRVGGGRVDILVAGRLVVELKTVDALSAVHQAQVLSYLKVVGTSLGLLINFNVKILKDGIKRVVLT